MESQARVLLLVTLLAAAPSLVLSINCYECFSTPVARVNDTGLRLFDVSDALGGRRDYTRPDRRCAEPFQHYQEAVSSCEGESNRCYTVVIGIPRTASSLTVRGCIVADFTGTCEDAMADMMSHERVVDSCEICEGNFCNGDPRYAGLDGLGGLGQEQGGNPGNTTVNVDLSSGASPGREGALAASIGLAMLLGFNLLSSLLCRS